MKFSLQLLPAVAGAAAALLLLKVANGYGERSLLSDHAAAVFASAKDVRQMIDPDVTGSTPAPKPEDKKDEKKGDKAEPKKTGDKAAPAPVVPPATPPISPAERALLERLGQRREQLDERQRELETRENLLKAADRKLETRINELKELESKPGGAASSPEAAAEQQQAQGLKNLVTMYETMKPKEAARVFDKLELAVLVPVVNAMNPRKMAEILAAMSPEAASKLTVELAMKGQRQQAQSARPAGLPAGELPSIDPKRP